MSLGENPYQSPAPIATEPNAEESAHWRTAFWVGVAFAILSVIALFVRNFPSGGPLIVSMAIFAVVTIASRRYRLRSAIALVVCLFLLGGVYFQYQLTRAQLMLEQERARAQAAMEQARLAEEMARRAISEQSRSQ